MKRRKHTSLKNHKTMIRLGPLSSLRGQVGGPGVCIHPCEWKHQLFGSEMHLPPTVLDLEQALSKGPDLFVKHFDVLPGGSLSKGSLPSQPCCSL